MFSAQQVLAVESLGRFAGAGGGKTGDAGGRHSAADSR